MKKFSLIIFMLLLTAFSLLANQRPMPMAAEAPAVRQDARETDAAPAPTPAESEPDAPQETPQAFLSGSFDGKVQISELMPKNKAALPDGQGNFNDWAELENISGAALSLEGWALTDREGQARWTFPATELAPGERLVVFFNGEQGPSFSLSLDETLYLLSPDGATQDQVLCTADHADHSLSRQADGSFAETPWISPGYENSSAGYEAWCASRSAGESLVIYEAVVYNKEYAPAGMSEPCDWVEIKNVSDRTVPLSGCSLSDKGSETRFTFPDQELAPGETLLVCCHDDTEDGSIGDALNTGFDLSAAREQLYLRDAEGNLLDYVALHDIPIGGSMGRMDGQPGFFYFGKSSPGRDNEGGVRRISAMPLDETADGIYNDVESVSVALSSPGEIHYTTDGTVPTLESPVYEAPLVLTETTLVRAVALEDGALLSPVATYSYIINENHTLPVLSIAVDDADRFNIMYQNGYRVWSVPGNLALYDGEHSFNHPCDVKIRGWTSLTMEKKSFGVSFPGRYGGNLECNVFDNGITEFSDLAIRAGQDYTFSIFRNELFQDLCLEANAACLTQASKYCILYVDGKYYGIYALKEDFSKQYYASHAGVSPESVTSEKLPSEMESEFQTQIIDPSWHDDFTNDSVYQAITQQLDLDSLIDWFLLESFCANTDIQGNVRLYRSTENGNKWTFCFYDLDWAFYYPNACFGAIIADKGNAGAQMPPLIRALIQNPEFRDRVLHRAAELLNGPLSNENILKRIDEYQALLEQEAPRDRERWGLSIDQWYIRVDELRSFVIDQDWEDHCIDQLCKYLHVGDMERQQIFGR